MLKDLIRLLGYSRSQRARLLGHIACGLLISAANVGSALILVAITGLFVLKGKKGITGRGAWLTGAGVLIPLVFLVMYL